MDYRKYRVGIPEDGYQPSLKMFGGCTIYVAAEGMFRFFKGDI